MSVTDSPGIAPSTSYLAELLDKVKAEKPRMILVAAYEDDRAGGRYVSPGGVFEVRLSAIVGDPAAGPAPDLLGITAKVDAQRGRIPEARMNALSVRLELQADCLAGVWAHHSQQGKGWLEKGDIEEALNAASRIGDDALQRQSTGTVRPESFTHGTSAQRVTWFKRGLQSGSVQECNTFEARQL